MKEGYEMTETNVKMMALVMMMVSTNIITGIVVFKIAKSDYKTLKQMALVFLMSFCVLLELVIAARPHY